VCYGTSDNYWGLAWTVVLNGSQHKWCTNTSLVTGFKLSTSFTERRRRVDNIPASYSGGSGLNHGQEIGYTDWSFRDFPQFLQANAAMVSYKYTTTSSFQILSSSSFIYRPFIWRYMHMNLVIEHAQLNKLQIKISTFFVCTWTLTNSLRYLLQLI
jgi:hypothetical protein